MLKIQKQYVEYLEKMKLYLGNTKIDLEKIDLQIQNIRDVELIVPVIGAFSAGKSTMINEFLGKQYLPVGITPETSLATELRYSNEEYIEAIKKDDSYDRYKIDEMNKIVNSASSYKYIKVYIDNERIKNIEPLILVDMPGFDSPLDLHNQAIVQYIDKGIYYIVLTSVEEGNITKSMGRQLQDIQEYGRGFSFFLSKSNLKAVSEVKLIADKIKEQVEDDFDMKKDVIPIGHHDGNDLEKILCQIDSEMLISNIFKSNLKENYYSLSNTLNTFVSVLLKDQSENENAIKELANTIKKLKKKKEDMLNKAKEKYSDLSVDKITDKIGVELSNSIEELLNVAIISGKDGLAMQIIEIVRHATIKELKNSMTILSGNIIDDFSIELKEINTTLSDFNNTDDWVIKIIENANRLFENTNNKLENIITDRNSKTDSKKNYTTITSILAIVTKVLSPILEMVIVFLPQIFSGIVEFMQKKKQKETIKKAIMVGVIPSIKSELRLKLTEIINDQVEQMIIQISKNFEASLQEKEDEISLMESERQDKNSNIEEMIKEYKEIHKNITNYTNEMLF